MDPKLLLLPLAAYAVVLLAVFAMQGAMLFPAAAVPAAPLPVGGERFQIAAASGERITAVHVSPREPPTDGRVVVLGFGGNAWNADAMAAYLAELYPQADVVTAHYRGYGPSDGRASARALKADAPKVLDAAAARVPGAPVVAVGFSVGSGIAATLAAERPLAGLILVTPFDSLGRVAAAQFPWLPVRLLFRHEIDAAAALRGIDVPLALIAAERDTVIPPARTAALRQNVREPVLEQTIPGAGHNDIYDRPEFRSAMRLALRRIRAAGT